MDRLVHTALNSIANLRDQRIVSAQNLANMNVPGFRRDLSNEGKAFFLDDNTGLTARALQLERGPHGFSQIPGMINQTGESLDIAIPDGGFFYVKPEQGDPALSRRGDLRVDLNGFLRNGAGDQMLNAQLQPITVPPFNAIIIDEVGSITIEPKGGEPGERVQVGTLATVIPQNVELLKGLDGHIRQKDGALPPPDQQARVMQGALEGSNVNSTEELIDSIELQRSFEINLKMITTARDIDEAGARLLRMPDG